MTQQFQSIHGHPSSWERLAEQSKSAYDKILVPVERAVYAVMEKIDGGRSTDQLEHLQANEAHLLATKNRIYQLYLGAQAAVAAHWPGDFSTAQVVTQRTMEAAQVGRTIAPFVTMAQTATCATAFSDIDQTNTTYFASQARQQFGDAKAILLTHYRTTQQTRFPSPHIILDVVEHEVPLLAPNHRDAMLLQLMPLTRRLGPKLF